MVGTNGYEETAGSDSLRDHVRASPASPGMSRDDLLTTNQKIVADVTQNLVVALAGDDPDRGHQPAGRDVPGRLRRGQAARASA